MSVRAPASHIPVPDGQRETASCENHPAKAEGPRDGVDTSSTLFPGCPSTRFPCIPMPGKRVTWTALQGPQRRGVCATDLDRDQASRLLEEKMRTTARTMENNRENKRKVPRRSQERLNCWYLPWSYNPEKCHPNDKRGVRSLIPNSVSLDKSNTFFIFFCAYSEFKMECCGRLGAWRPSAGYKLSNATSFL